MDAKELAIGDWVFDTIRQKSVRVDGLSYAGIRGEEDVVFYRDDVYEPIPLTPEILEKNGFKDIGDNTWQLEEKPYWFWVDFYNHEYGCEFDTSTYEYEDTERRLKLYGDLYVHQLQHALRLCGFDKEITL